MVKNIKAFFLHISLNSSTFAAAIQKSYNYGREKTITHFSVQEEKFLS